MRTYIIRTTDDATLLKLLGGIAGAAAITVQVEDTKEGPRVSGLPAHMISQPLKGDMDRVP